MCLLFHGKNHETFNVNSNMVFPEFYVKKTVFLLFQPKKIFWDLKAL